MNIPKTWHDVANRQGLTAKEPNRFFTETSC